MAPLSAHPKIWQVLTVIFLAITAAFGLFFYFSNIFLAFIIAFSLIFLAEKFATDYRRSVARYHLSRWKQHVYGYALVAFWIFAVIFLFRSSTLQITGVLQKVSVNEATLVDVYSDKVQPLLPAFFQREAFTEEIVEKVSEYVSSLTSVILSKGTFFLVDALLIVPLMFFMYFRRRHAIATKLFGSVPARFHDSVLRGAREIGAQLHHFFAIRVIENTIVGALCCLGFFIAGVKGWLILGLIAGFLNIVPYFGPIMGAVPPLLITLLVDEPVAALYVILTVLIAQTIDEFYLRPFVVSGKVRIDPLLSIILVLVGSQLFGIMGMIFALPTYLVYKVILQEAYEELVKLYGQK